jgi:hypothetical protein
MMRLPAVPNSDCACAVVEAVTVPYPYPVVLVTVGKESVADTLDTVAAMVKLLELIRLNVPALFVKMPKLELIVC